MKCPIPRCESKEFEIVIQHHIEDLEKDGEDKPHFGRMSKEHIIRIDCAKCGVGLYYGDRTEPWMDWTDTELYWNEEKKELDQGIPSSNLTLDDFSEDEIQAALEAIRRSKEQEDSPSSPEHPQTPSDSVE